MIGIKRLPKPLRKRFKNILIKPLALWHRKNLKALATLYETDKHGFHDYMPAYQIHFENFRKRPLNLLEIGVGGFEDSNKGGHSLRMWKSYFKRGNIYAIDIVDKSSLQESRIKIFKGSQDDPKFLKETVQAIGNIDLIIDDGSHLNEHVIKSFKFLFPLLNQGGVYAIEDTQTAYWSSLGGGHPSDHNLQTSMNYLKSLVDGLNYKEFKWDYEPTFMDEHIKSIHFYHNLVFIFKK